MALGLGWKVKEGTLGPDDVVAPHERLDWGRTVGLGAQHVVAMFGATFVFPLVMGLNPQLAIMMSGIATIAFLLIVQGRVPSYLGTSAAFVGGVAAIRSQGGDSSEVTGAILVAGLVLGLVGLVALLVRGAVGCVVGEEIVPRRVDGVGVGEVALVQVGDLAAAEEHEQVLGRRGLRPDRAVLLARAGAGEVE